MREIESLIKRAEKYLLSAGLLLGEGDYESTVSRIYYAMFYSAQSVLLTKNLSYSSHKMVIASFGENFIKTNIFPKEMGRELNRAFDKRQISDYNFTFVISKSEAEQLLETGEEFVTEIKKFLNLK